MNQIGCNTISSNEEHKESQSSENFLGLSSANLQTVINFETIPLEKRKEITNLLNNLDTIDGNEGNPFFTIEKDGIVFDHIQNILSTITSLFEGWKESDDTLRIKISDMIAGATENEKNIEKILFVFSPLHIGMESYMRSELGDKINKKNNINIWDEQGNGGYFDKITTSVGNEFAHVYVTEHKLTQKSNAVVVVISAYRRPRYIMMSKSQNLRQDEKEKLWTMTDKEVIDHYYVINYD